MAPDDTSGARPAPVALRIKLRYDTVETLVQRFAPNVGKSGLFLPTKSLQPVGAEVKFELRLADDKVVITGLGRVKNAKAPDPAAPKAAFGMGVELMRVTPTSRDVILKILARRKELGLAEVGIPSAADIDAARTTVDTGVREAAASGIPSAVPLADSGPVLETGPVPRAAIATPVVTPVVAAPTSDTDAIRAVTPNPDGPLRDSNPVLEGPAPKMTSPRRHSGSIAVQKLSAVEALAPEPPRKKRPNVQEIVDRASGPVALATNVPGLDDDVDVQAVLARARALATGDLDAELDALRESAAAPLAISIEAASAELARALGGAAVSRDRSAKWAPPPRIVDEAPVAEDARALAAKMLEATPVVEAPVAEAPVAEAPVAEAPAPTPDPEFVAQTTQVEATPDEVHAAPPLEAPAETTPALIDDDVSADAFVARDSAPVLELEPDPETPDPDAQEVGPEQIADEIHALADGDFEEVEHTEIAREIEPVATMDRDLEARVAQQIEADQDEDMGLADLHAAIAPETYRPAPTLAGYSAPETYTKPVILQPTFELPPYDPKLDPLIQPPAPDVDDGEEGAEPVGDFEIVAEADADDADLLAAHGDEEVQEQPGSDLADDFAARLEFSDEHERFPDEPGEAALDAALEDSALDALAGFATQDPDSNFPPLHRFDQSDVIHVPPEPQVLTSRSRTPTRGGTPAPRAASQPQRAQRVESYDLENALEALDVDLDDLSVEEDVAPPPVLHKRRPSTPSQAMPAQTPRDRGPSRQMPVPTHVPKRATTDDGVLIDFDDDDE
ncbi:MAG TPA: hypothetical protein VGM90_38940 [Kofleriaceae bacterium]|jgi:hypothetical protein